MKARRFATIEEITGGAQSYAKTCSEDWKKLWHKCIIFEGDYFEGDNIDIGE